LADLIGSWGNTRLFSESIDKTSFGLTPPTIPPREEAFTQVVDRFERYLAGIGGQQTIGLLAHDHDDTSADRLTQLMRHFHAGGTMWNRITHIIETPFFVDSRLTVGVQLADLCAYAIRRFCENGETDLLIGFTHEHTGWEYMLSECGTMSVEEIARARFAPTINIFHSHRTTLMETDVCS